MSNLFDDEITEYYTSKDKNIFEYLSSPTNLSKFLKGLCKVSLDVFEKILNNLITCNLDQPLPSTIFVSIIKNQITHLYVSDTSIIQKILIKARTVILKHSFNEKFVLYNHCINTIKEKAQCVKSKDDIYEACKIYELIFGSTSETDAICQALTENNDQNETLFKKQKESIQEGSVHKESIQIYIYIKSLAQQILPLEINVSATIENVKSKIQEETGIFVRRQRLLFAGKPLEDGKTLSHYSYIQKNSTIVCSI